ncbi:uncharacterized protein PAC_06627 [Phialocephala subalpina]|uniref:Telomeric single stranded DNA binding POT1/Cdc13 domain-containing protein n=1 Tax=Phialocephala subalpina TaxID=576137 RepID=A0A1L7WVD6_9HELO|nr:uncharacterized protein PAC_06627 [Phialocephala subalpina]
MEGQTNGATAMETTAHIPIAQLTPLLSTPDTRSFKAIVTLTWPYSSATGSIAFLLSEPDFRLRRTRGQVRVQFAGSSAKNVAKAGIASGDEVTLCLDGVEWIEGQNDAATPGRGVEFELKFTEKLYLQFKQQDASEVSTISIDHPAPEPEAAPIFARIPTPEPSPTLPVANGASPHHSIPLLDADEWSSPAFLKRARTSYGSLFDSDYDPFAEEDGTVPGKGRKRPKTRLSSTWRYSSRSPTPEEEDSVMEQPVVEPAPEHTPPTMADEACQTVGLEVGVAAETLADFARQATNVGSTSYTQSNGLQLPEGGQPNGAVQDVEPAVMQPLMQPPRIQTQQPELSPDQPVDFNHEAPSSPRLHPIPSDSLPLVSPLVSHTYGLNFGQPRPVTPDAPLDNHLSIPNGTALADDEDDIYGASPVGRCGDISSHGFNGFQAPAGSQGAEFPAVAGYAIEDQYGHWQNANAQLSRSASPPKPDDYYHEGAPPEQSYADQEPEEYEHGLPISPHGTSQYPELHAELPGAVQYPEIPEENGVLDNQNASYPLPHPHLSRLSRSQSAQSPVVDLTENSDEEEQDEGEVDEGSLRESDAEEEHEEDELVEEYGHDDGSQPHHAQRGHYIEREHDSGDVDGSEDDAEGSQDLDEENVYYFEDEADGEDDELEQDPHNQRNLEANDSEGYDDDEGEDLEQDPRYQRAFEATNAEGYDDDGKEEGSYDEEDESYDEDEMVDEELEPAPKRAPVVIDLLSSDDEDAADTVPSGHQSAPPQVQQNPAESDHESEQSESEEDEDDESAVPYNERTEIRTRRASEYDIKPDMPIYEQDDEELLDEQDDMAQHGIDARDTKMLRRRATSVDESEEDEDSTGSESDEELMEDDSREADDGPQTPEHEETALTKSGDSPKTPSSARPVEQRVQSSGRASLFARVFNLDGANDSPSPPASVVNEDLNSQELIEQTVQSITAQLPTPDDTQLSHKVVTAESSFSSMRIEQTEDKIDGDRSEVEVEVSTMVEIISEEVMIDTTSDNVQLPFESAESKAASTGQSLEDDDVVMTEEVFETHEVVESAVTTENDDTFMIEAAIEDTMEEEEKTEFDDIAQNNESIMSKAQAENSVASKIDESLQNAETITEEITEMEEDEEDAAVVASDSAGESVEIAEETKSAEQPEPGFSESAVEYLAKAIKSNEIDEPIREEMAPEPAHQQNTHVEVVIEEPASEPIQEQNTHVEVVVEEPEFTKDHPRRSHRNVNEAPGGVDRVSEKESEVDGSIPEESEEPGDSVQEHVEVVVEQPKFTAKHPRRSHRRANESFSDPAEHSEKDEADGSVLEEPGPDSVEENHEVSTDEPKFTVDHPRRSHRRAKSTTSTSKTEEDARPATPVKSRVVIEPVPETNEETSPMVIVDSQSTPKGQDASIELALARTPKGHDASIELALSSLESPSKQAHDLRKPPVADVKLRLSRNLRTELSEFTSLKVIRYHLNQKLDILAIATTTPPEPQRAKGGPRQYQITFNITDPSIAPSGVAEVQVFRPYSNALPTIEAGDGILLRNFQVTSTKKGFGLRSTQEEGSSWAVFKDSSEEPEIRGPPVEFGDGEKNHIIAMKAWYSTLDDVSKAKISRANGDKAAARR